MNEDNAQLSFIPIEEITTPVDGARVYVDHWWSVHPTKGVIFFRQYAPQCNRSEFIARRVGRHYPWADTVFIPVAYIPRRNIDTRY